MFTVPFVLHAVVRTCAPFRLQYPIVVLDMWCVAFSGAEIPRFCVCLNNTQDYELLPCLLLLSSMSACSALLGLKLPVCGNHRRLILEHSINHALTSAPVVVTKRRNSWACRGNPNPEQETIKGTHTQETPAYQRRPWDLLGWCARARV